MARNLLLFRPEAPVLTGRCRGGTSPWYRKMTKASDREKESRTPSVKKAATKKAPVKKAAAKKTAVKKAPAKTAAKKKAPVKKAAAKKTAPGKAPGKRAQQAATARAPRRLTHELRWRMISEEAYLLAEKRGFVGGNEQDDWLAAEADVDAQLVAEGVEVVG